MKLNDEVTAPDGDGYVTGLDPKRRTWVGRDRRPQLDTYIGVYVYALRKIRWYHAAEVKPR